MDIPINELAILCVAKILCGEGYVAKGILISPMYIYNKNAAALWGVGGVSLRNLDKLVGIDHLLSHYSDNI